MSNPNASRSKVQSIRLQGRAVSACLAQLDGIVSAGAACQEVQTSPVTQQAHADLGAAVALLQASVADRVALGLALRAAGTLLRIDLRAASAALVTYEVAVASLAHGNAAIITGAGLLADGPRAPAALGNVTAVESRPGKALGEAILRWPEVPGATGYAIEVCFTLETAGPWTALSTGSARRRTVTAPAPGAQLLARVAAVASDGRQSDWSDPVLVTAR
jgi:hypothetical protein